MASPTDDDSIFAVNPFVVLFSGGQYRFPGFRVRVHPMAAGVSEGTPADRSCSADGLTFIELIDACWLHIKRSTPRDYLSRSGWQ